MTTDTSTDQLTFLESINAQLDQAGHCQVDNSTLLPADNMIAPLTHYGLLAIDGADTGKFLQGQTTCDLDEVDANNARAGAYCTPKGRMISSFYVARHDTESYLLRMRRALVDSTRDVFAKYIVFSKAEQQNANDRYLAIGLYGSQASAAITAALGEAPSALNASVSKDGNIALQLDREGLSYECWIRSEQLLQLWPKLAQGLTLQGSRSWELLCIRRGQGDVCPETVDSFIPQMLNYQITDAISFTKGCYTGQEVVARMEYRGKLKRRMYRIEVDSTDLQPGTELYRPDSEQSIGNIVNVVQLENKLSEALAVITNNDAQLQLVLTGSNRVATRLLSLPYAITSDEP